MTRKSRLLLRGPLACCWMALVSSLAWAQTSAPYADLVAKSVSLSPDQKSKAAQLFSTGFSLWQGGDFASAKMAFQEGLDIDPANPEANFYYGDSLRVLKQRREAAEYLRRASTLGAGSPESFKARTALTELAKAPSIGEMSTDDLKKVFVGSWVVAGMKEAGFTIDQSGSGDLIFRSDVSCFLCGEYKDFKFDGQRIMFSHSSSDALFSLKLISQNVMEGDQLWKGSKTNLRFVRSP